MLRSFIIILFVFASFSYMYSQYDKDKLFERMNNHFSNIKSVSLNFSLNDNQEINGSLLAKRGNKFILALGKRKIYSDGETIWNYMPENKNVIVSKFEAHGESASIEKIFFEFTNNYMPVDLKKVQNSVRGAAYILELKPNKNFETDITRINLHINPETLDIYNFIIIRNYAEENWEIKNLKLNPQAADNKFVFKPQEDVEVIDLR